MGTYINPERPREFGPDPLQRAQGGVRAGTERARDILREFTEYGPEVQERIISIANRVRQEVGNDGQALERSLEFLNELLRQVEGRLPGGWTYDDLLREFDAELAKRKSEIAPPSPETSN